MANARCIGHVGIHDRLATRRHLRLALLAPDDKLATRTHCRIAATWMRLQAGHATTRSHIHVRTNARTTTRGYANTAATRALAHGRSPPAAQTTSRHRGDKAARSWGWGLPSALWFRLPLLAPPFPGQPADPPTNPSHLLPGPPPRQPPRPTDRRLQVGASLSRDLHYEIRTISALAQKTCRCGAATLA